ncbi:MAG: RecX family transcriptional regulator [Anaerolineaceae bacterium]|nr:RecX family transcriptional regulator [Anaerolineaceae bacterium]
MRVDGKITAIEPQKRQKHRRNIYLDGEFAFSLDRLTAVWLKEGQTLSTQEITRLQQKDGLEAAYNRALHLLSIKARSLQEVEQFLQRKGYAEEFIPSVIARLKEDKFLDDRRFAEDWVDNRASFRPRSISQMRFELLQKGVSRDLADAALQQAGLDENALALKAGQKMAKRYAALDQKTFMRRLGAALTRRGFNFEAAQAACKQLWQDLKQNTL